jgi:hypothetical protein
VIRRQPQLERQPELEQLLVRKRAAIVSPPVTVLISPSASDLPSSTSIQTTRRFPRSRAMSLRTPASPRRFKNDSKSAVAA